MAPVGIKLSYDPEVNYMVCREDVPLVVGGEMATH